eukprot:COSAG01_NODE_8684_length_2697_cov_8.200154_5_plen_99_part_00
MGTMQISLTSVTPPTGVKYARGSKVYQLPASRSIRLAKRGCAMAISVPRVEMHGAVVRAARWYCCPYNHHLSVISSTQLFQGQCLCAYQGQLRDSEQQ